MTDRFRSGRRLVIAMILSGGAHAAALAWVSIRVPELSSARIRLVRASPLELADRETALRVVEIRPPGIALPMSAAPAGTSGGETEGGKASRDGAGGGETAAASLVAAALATPRPGASSAAPLADAAAALATPVATGALALPALFGPEAAASEDEAMPGARPARGVVLRAGGAGTRARPGIGSGATGAAGPGGLGSGVTIVGPGGDCITPGQALPGGQALPTRLPEFEPGRGPAPRPTGGRARSGKRPDKLAR